MTWYILSFHYSRAWFLYTYVLLFSGKLYGFYGEGLLFLEREMVLKSFGFAHSHFLFCAPPGFNCWSSYRRGFLANLRIGGYFWGYNSYPLHCTYLCSYVTCEVGSYLLTSALWYLGTLRFKFIHIFPHHHTLWFCHLPGVGQHNSIRSLSGHSGSGCVMGRN